MVYQQQQKQHHKVTVNEHNWHLTNVSPHVVLKPLRHSQKSILIFFGAFFLLSTNCLGIIFYVGLVAEYIFLFTQYMGMDVGVRCLFFLTFRMCLVCCERITLHHHQGLGC